MVYHHPSKRILATTDAFGGAIVRINSENLSIEGSVQIGHMPRRLALSDDGSALFVALSFGTVRKYLTASNEPSEEYSLGGTFPWSVYVQDLEVLPNTANSIVVSALDGVSSQYTQYIKVIDELGIRPIYTSEPNYFSQLVFSPKSHALFGTFSGPAVRGLRGWKISPNGISLAANVPLGMSGSADIEYAGGILYSDGRAIESESLTVLGSYMTSANEVEVADNRIYFSSDTTGQIHVFNRADYSEIDRISFPECARIIRMIALPNKKIAVACLNSTIHLLSAELLTDRFETEPLN